MCSDGVAKGFRRVYPAVGTVTAAVCLYAVSMSPPLHIEVYSTTSKPVNGTIQVIQCHPVIISKEGGTISSCERVVDQPTRLHVDAYHLSMGIPFIACCVIGAVFCSLTKKEDSTVFNINNLFTPESYTPVGGGSAHHNEDGGGGGSMYTWELVFWGYISITHWVLVSVLTSPSDIFDTAVSIGFTVLCLMFLCRPRGSDNNGGGGGGGMIGMQGLVLSTLLLCTWLTFSSIPHAYEADRGWLFASVLVMDGLLLLVHMYDDMPTMYTIVMGRLTYVSLVNLWLSYAFYSLDDRLSEYIHVPVSSPLPN